MKKQIHKDKQYATRSGTQIVNTLLVATPMRLAWKKIMKISRNEVGAPEIMQMSWHNEK